MRKLMLSIILLLISSAWVNAQSNEKQNFRLTGPVRAVREEVARLENHSGQFIEGSRVLIESMTFDKQGNLIEQFANKLDGSLNWKQGWARTYDNEGKEVQKTIYNAEGGLIGVHVYSYDSGGRKIKLTRYNPDESIKFYREYVYDEKGRIKDEYDRNEDGSLQVHFVYVYNDKGQQIERAHYSPDETPPYRFLSTYDEYGNIASFSGSPSPGVITFQDTYKYDKRGNLLKRVGSAGAMRTKMLYSSYEFDTFGNWIKRKTLRTTMNNGNKQVENEITYRTITYY
jgi:hypothetical protein